MSEKNASLNRLDSELIAATLHAFNRDRVIDLQVIESTGSTNDQVMSRLPSSNCVFSACVANHQTAGRGRNGKQWVSPPDANIYLSVGTVLDSSLLSDMGGLSLACGVSMANLLSTLNINVGLKWPNDILFDEKKLAGILVETRIRAKKVFVVVGVGINMQMPEVAARYIEQPWVDLKSIIKKKGLALDRNDLTAKILNEIVLCVDRYKQAGFDSFANDWDKFDMLVGRDVVIDAGEQLWGGRVLGVADDYALRVCVEGKEEIFYAADVKLKLN